ncbi:MAG: DUF4830 domain-containing protein [Ruminococcaceae bacterium]|nr:DUF4830 domain-containing protein [Oscillospiraceae bacterium]
MFILTARLSRKKIFRILLITLTIPLILLLCFMPRASEDTEAEPVLKNNADRIAYLQSLGWDVEPEPTESLQLLLPETLPDNYIAYNQIQLAQGFDLNTCCGKQLTRYTYTVNNYPNYPKGVQLNLYICSDRVAAGDIIATGANGFQAGIHFPRQAAEP